MYFPKNKIETNLYSNGEFVIQSSSKVYYGLYFKTSNKECYTGAEPSNTSKRLIPLDITEDAQDSRTNYDLRFLGKNYTYSVLTNQPLVQDKIEVTPYIPQPTKEEYEIGSFPRYFTKKRNETVYYEVTSGNFSELRNAPMYLPFFIIWQIRGDKDYVYNNNKRAIEVSMESLPIPLFNKFLKDDYLKFWKPS